MAKFECIFCDEEWSIEGMKQETLELCATTLVLMKLCPAHADELTQLIAKREAGVTA